MTDFNWVEVEPRDGARRWICEVNGKKYYSAYLASITETNALRHADLQLKGILGAANVQLENILKKEETIGK